MTWLVGNWKMNHQCEDVRSFMNEMKSYQQNGRFFSSSITLGIAPQYLHLSLLKMLNQELNPSPFLVGAQNCAAWESGAYTGEVSAKAIKDVGAEFVIIGHSERRLYLREGHDTLKKKVLMALSQGLKVIFCVGETLEQREKGEEGETVRQQLEFSLGDINPQHYSQLLMAYEPVWAIGTGKTASPEIVMDMHFYIRSLLKNLFGGSGDSTPILYGGSISPKNIGDFCSLENVSGFLVGGASLKASEYMTMVEEYLKKKKF